MRIPSSGSTDSPRDKVAPPRCDRPFPPQVRSAWSARAGEALACRGSRRQRGLVDGLGIAGGAQRLDSTGRRASDTCLEVKDRASCLLDRVRATPRRRRRRFESTRIRCGAAYTMLLSTSCLRIVITPSIVPLAPAGILLLGLIGAGSRLRGLEPLRLEVELGGHRDGPEHAASYERRTVAALHPCSIGSLPGSIPRNSTKDRSRRRSNTAGPA